MPTALPDDPDALRIARLRNLTRASVKLAVVGRHDAATRYRALAYRLLYQVRSADELVTVATRSGTDAERAIIRNAAQASVLYAPPCT
jgi:hypothetical protein